MYVRDRACVYAIGVVGQRSADPSTDAAFCFIPVQRVAAGGGRQRLREKKQRGKKGKRGIKKEEANSSTSRVSSPPLPCPVGCAAVT